MPSAQASGSPASSVSAVDAAACHSVNQRTSHVSGRAERRPTGCRREARARGSRRTGTRRTARETRPAGRRAPRQRAARPLIATAARCRATRRPSRRGRPRFARPGASADVAAGSRTARTRGEPAFPSAPGRRTCSAARRPGSARREGSRRAARALWVPRPAQDPGVLDLPEAAVLDGGGGRPSSGLPAKITSAAGLVAYETTIGRLPGLPEAPENCCVYASSQPSVTSTSFERSLRQ